MNTNKAILMILDGWGIAPDGKGNAVTQAKTPFLDKFLADNPNGQLTTSGLDVGLPAGIMGNSEVGHLNIGAGRTVFQLNTLIDSKIEDGSFFKNEALISALTHAKKNNSKVHIMGLLSDGGVHSSLKHLSGLLDFFKEKDFDNVYYHAFMDGRDTSPTSGKDFLTNYEKEANEKGLGKVATLTGRYYAMDRDNRWERVEKAYRGLVNGDGERFDSAISAIESSYKNDKTDEFVDPAIIMENGEPIALISENDSVIFFNFRSDRPRELTRTFIYNNFDEFKTTKFTNLKFITFTPYDQAFADKVEIAFRAIPMNNLLGKIIAEKELKQLRTAETEKYAHVTFFFNGGIEEPFKNETRILVDSPKVASYDLQPEMSAFEVKDKLVEQLNKSDFDLIVVNFANCDMVGHTGDISAAIKAVEVVDQCSKEVVQAAKNNNYNIFMTADHGNADKLLDDNGNVFTAHSKNPVPFVVSLINKNDYAIANGTLADIAPTMLSVMNIEIPKEMTGKILIKEK